MTAATVGPWARTGRYLAPIGVGVAGLVAWQLLVDVVGVSEYLLPSPASIGRELVASAGPIVDNTLITGGNVVVGLVLGTVLAVGFAAAAARFASLDQMLTPLVAALAVIPIVALAPVLNSMFGADSQAGRRLIATVAAFVPVFVNTLRGLRQTAPLHRDLLTAYAASGWQAFRTVTLPTAMPHLLTGIRIASSLAVISALVAEYFGGPRGGIGAFISTSAATSAYARAWAYVGAAIVLGLVFYAATVLLERIARHRYPTGGVG